MRGGRAGWAVLGLALLLVVPACSSGTPKAASSTGPAASAPAPSPSPSPSPIPIPSGPPVTTGQAAGNNFLLFLGGDLNSYAVTRIEGQLFPGSGAPASIVPQVPSQDPGDAVFAPALSPDHKRVAYVELPAATLASASNDGGGPLVVQNVDGTGAKMVATGDNLSPAWSPDGTKLAFVRGGQLYTMGADGSNQQSLGINGTVDFHVSWSPDGTRIAFGAGNPAQVEIVTLADKSVAPLGSVPQAGNPTWSPDGSKLVFFESGSNALFVASADGSGAQQLTTCADPCTRDLEPSWSKDGTYIAYTRATNTNGVLDQQIWVVPAAGGTPQQVTTGPEGHAFPSW
ncbi:MAG TPA: hypothetical protein VFW71_01565 [Actinomycetota bacterium]|nr:hypothetical protein [Actinomycetota bacterium]